ncbi:type IV pilin [Natronorubrum sulfidifaciens]|uniref:Archaeal Type IV pilin N-terminal domain-containing protein n=1 Tax=Natronorubrum sulfidifaciens JCM 14089 TaxID=1230460 RepID=L9WF56_9EURY|nr:type IV pilin N-terminal domain-containing protein [Natronorubrum sulfidifaciens]ELY48084.1 hypothetical protein C495_01380 [Natronorubrum sulfidifaciens JCM 14089]
MDLKQIRPKLIGDETERTVSPVIGVILMVAITVILAAVIAAFVLDIGDLDDSAPQAQYDWETSNDGENVSISHTSGDDIDLSVLTATVDTENGTATGDLGSGDFTAGDTIEFGTEADEIQVTDSVDETLSDDGTDIEPNGEIEEVTITWESDGTSTILANYEP